MTSDAGAPGFRVEDEPLVRGEGLFMADMPLPDQAYGHFVRSPHAHAAILGIDAEAARGGEGVLAVLTSDDMIAAGAAGPITRHFPMTGRDGRALIDPIRPALAAGRVVHIGEPVALVVATTPGLAQDAAERVAVDYEVRDAVSDAREATVPDAPQLWPEAPGNLAIDWQAPPPKDGANERAVADAVAGAPHVARVSLHNQRIAVASMEPRGGTASHDHASDSYTMRVCSQSPVTLRDGLAGAMRIDPSRLRVVTDDVGGAFGMKSCVYPEYPALLVAAKRTGRPVHWMGGRSESFVTDNQARDMSADGELAIGGDGTFLALRLSCVVNLGAYVGFVGVHLATNNFVRCLPAMYHIPLIDVRVRGVFTNTVPTAPYRGAGRPEAIYLLERLVDEAARVTGIAPAEIRRRNLIPPAAIPYDTPVGTTYDSGNFPAVFEKALALSGHGDFPQRRSLSAERGRLRGIGICCLLEHAGGMPAEGAGLIFPGDGTVELHLGAQATGQAHATVFPRVVAKELGVPVERVRMRQGDSGLGVASSSTVASRTTMTAGTAIVRAAEVVVTKGRKLAADVLEAAEADIVYERGAFVVTGTDRRIELLDLARDAAAAKERGEIAEALDTTLTVNTPQTFPNGCHVAEVEVDPDTGAITLENYTAVDDGGNILDHMVVDGQVHGSIVQGAGQVLMEHLVYDPAGQLVTGSFMDYAMPRAADMPLFTVADCGVPATTNPLGVKGVGEAGTTGALAAIMNAIADAVPAGAHMDMPATAEKVWAACREGGPQERA